MHSRADHSKAVANRDIDPSDQLVETHPELECLLHNSAISIAFAGFEKSALRWKLIYTFFGRLSLVAVLLAMMSYDYQITLKHIYGAPIFGGHRSRICRRWSILAGASWHYTREGPMVGI